jgi:NitT/TauT family transport system substrate-binding protein
VVRDIAIGIATPPGMTAANGYFSAAAALGYDRDEGLSFCMYYGDEPGATARALCAGTCAVASLNTTVGLLGREQGLPMMAVYGKARRTHRWFAVVENSPIRRLGDLRHKRIACDFDHLRPLAEAALAEECVPAGSFEWVPWRGSGMQAGAMVAPLRAGEIDAVFLIDWNDGDFIAEGLPLRRLPSRALDRIRLSSCLWAAPDFLRRDPDAIAGAGRALAKITVFALENPEAAVRLMWQQHPQTRPTVDAARVLRRDLEIMKARLRAFAPEAGATAGHWGAIERDDIVAWQDFLLNCSALKQREDPDGVFTTQFVDHFNAFDAATLRVQARAFSRIADHGGKGMGGRKRTFARERRS